MNDKSQTFLEHLEELRNTIIYSLIALVGGMCIAAPLAPRILSLLKIPLARAGKDPDMFLIQLKVAGGLSVAVHIAFWSGLLIALPFVLFFIARFVFPGLREKERRAILGSSLFALLLFVAGVAMGFYCIRFALRFMFMASAWMGISHEQVLITDYISFVLKLLIGFGLAFELPELIFILGYLGLVHSQTLCDKRRHVCIGILFMSMMLTPQDPFTMILMAAPLYALYEICIIAIRYKEKKEELL